MNLSMKEAIKRGLRPGVMLTTLLIFGTLIGIGTVNGDSFITMLNAIFSSLMVNGGWLISLGTLGFIIFLLIILFHPIGNVKLGGKDAKPEYSLWNWFAISLCAGIGTGIVFWGPVEPLKFAVQPQASTGLVGGTLRRHGWRTLRGVLARYPAPPLDLWHEAKHHKKQTGALLLYNLRLQRLYELWANRPKKRRRELP